MKDSKRNCSPEQSWYSGSCLTVDTWRLSGSRQLHKEPEILTKRFTYRDSDYIIRITMSVKMLLLSHSRKRRAQRT
jgi:hypothetical protein